MFQDDRMIPVLTAVLLMVVVGTFLQRSDRDADKAGAAPEVVQLVDDQVTAPAGALVRIDALANDSGITDEMRAGLTVVTSPACGRLFVRNGVLEYMAGEACSGRQTIRYTVTGAPDGQLATVTARIRGGALPVNAPPARSAPAEVEAAPVVASVDDAPATPTPRDGDASALAAAADRAPELAADEPSTPRGPIAPVTGAADASRPEMPTLTPPPRSTTGDAVAEGRPPASGDLPGAAAATNHATAPAPASGPQDGTPEMGGIARAPAPELPTAPSTGTISRSEPDAVAAALPAAETGTAPGDAAVPSDAAAPAGAPAVTSAPENAPATASAAPAGTPHGIDTESAAATPPAAATPSGGAGAAPPEAPAGRLAGLGSPADPPGTGVTNGTAAGIGTAGPIAASTPAASAGPARAAAADDQPDLAASSLPGRQASDASDTGGAGHAAPDAGQPAPAEMATSDPAQVRGHNATASAPAAAEATGPATEPEQQVAMAPATGGEADDRDEPATPAGTESDAGAPPEPQMVLASLAPPVPAEGPALPGGPGAPVRIVNPAAMHGPAAAASPRSGAAITGQDPAGLSGADTRAADARRGGAGAGAGSFMMTVAGRVPHAVPPTPPLALGIGDAPAPVLPAAIAPGARAANAASDAPKIARLAPALAATPPAGPSLAVPGLPIILPPPRPSRTAGDADVRTARLDPGAIGGATLGDAATGGTAPEQAPATGGTRLARLPDQTAACVIAPAMTLEVHTAGETVVSVTAPCHAGTVAELSYSGLRFAMPIDQEGHGRITALGFEPNAPALLAFADGGQIDFDLPFKGIGRVSRVALAWETPVDLALNALEYDAPPYSAGHVAPRRPRSFAQVRRTGGGWLSTYHAAAGVGQNVQVYSWWHRQGEEPGVVRLLVDFVSRQLGAPGTCGNGAAAAPQFLVLRSEFGRPERPVLRQLAPVDCASIQPGGDESLISGAVEDLVITDR